MSIDSAPVVNVDRVLGGGPFCELGWRGAMAESGDGTLIVAAGAFRLPQWHGHDVSRRSRPNPGWFPIGIYRAADLTCLSLFTVRWPVNAISFHPSLPLVAIGAGSYDGGWMYDGELLILDLTADSMVSVLEYPREVRRVSWRDDETLDLVLAVRDDEAAEEAGTTSVACSVRRDDWDRATERMLKAPYDDEKPVHDETPGGQIATSRPLSRQAVWALHALPDGRILAGLDGVALECWSRSSAEPLWRIPAEGTGCQIRVLPDGRTALALTSTRTYETTIMKEVDLEAGVAPVTFELFFPAVMASSVDGWVSFRDTAHDARAGTGMIHLLTPEGTHGGTVQVGGYDLFNHFFDIRHSPQLLFLQGNPDEPWRDKWVVALDGRQRRVRRLFPLEWDGHRGGHLFGGSGVYLEDARGPALVHSGAVHNGAGLLPGNAFVVRRAFPSGEAQWVFAADHQATAVDVDGDSELVYVTFNNGELVALRAADGTVHGRQRLRVGGHPVVPMSLTYVGSGRLAIGTLDGRILDCSYGGKSLA
ncbi:MAG TPA: hypothetical protein VF062_18170 [Candidatus Limnocylindrales bacterium]